jgi:hypothetical protein
LGEKRQKIWWHGAQQLVEGLGFYAERRSNRVSPQGPVPLFVLGIFGLFQPALPHDYERCPRVHIAGLLGKR